MDDRGLRPRHNRNPNRSERIIDYVLLMFSFAVGGMQIIGHGLTLKTAAQSRWLDHAHGQPLKVALFLGVVLAAVALAILASKVISGTPLKRSCE